MTVFTERSKREELNNRFDTSTKRTALKTAAEMMRLGYIPDDLERLASMIDPDGTRPKDRQMSLQEAALYPKKILKLSILAVLNLRIVEKHLAKNRGRLGPDDPVTKGLSKKDRKAFRVQCIKELAAEFDLNEHTIRRYIREAKKRTSNS